MNEEPPFLEEAVRAYLFERALNQAKTAAADMSEAELPPLSTKRCNGRANNKKLS
jgi:hypothetical protein